MSQNKRGAAQAAPLLFFNSNRNILQKMTVFATLFKELAGPLQSLRRNKSYGMNKLRKSDRTTHLAPKMHYYKVMKAKGKKITNSEGFSLVELLIVVAIILIIAAIAIPNLLRSRMAANQAAAVATLRNINNSQATYISTYSQSGYADTFVKLGPGVPCDSTHACLVDEIIGCAAQPCAKSGYKYFIASTSAAPPIADYRTTATPITWASNGLENYCSMTDGVLRKQVAPSGSLGSVVSAADCPDITKYVAVQ